MSNQENPIEQVKQTIIKRKLTSFFQKNSSALAILLKALIKGEKAYPKPNKNNSSFQAAHQEHQDQQSSPQSTQTTKKPKKDSQSPLNIQG